MAPTLSLLIASLDSRRPLLDRLMAGLEPQLRAAGDAVEIRVLSDGGQLPTGTKRQRLLNESCGRYVACVDDDDLLSPDYVSEILTAAETNADQLTFNLRRSWPSGVEEWRFTAFDTTPADQGHRRDAAGRLIYFANHLCPTKREILVQVPWLPISFREDISHYEAIWAAGLVRNAIHVDRVLYLYLWRPDPEGGHRAEARRQTLALLRRGLRVFRHVPTARIAIETGEPSRGGRIEVYTPGGGREAIAAGDLQAIHTLRRCR